MERKLKGCETASNGILENNDIADEEPLHNPYDTSQEQLTETKQPSSRKCTDLPNSGSGLMPELEESFQFNDDRDGLLEIPYKSNHVLLIYRSLQVGLCTDMEVVFPDATFKCHRWVVESYIGIENIKLHLTTKEKFITEYLCCLKAPELPILLRAFYRHSDTQDFIISIGLEEFKCHYDVLRCYTDFFDKMERNKRVKLPKKDVTVRAFFIIYRGWMLDQIPRLPVRGILEVYRAAKYLRIKLLVKTLMAELKRFDETNGNNEKNTLKYMPPKLLNKFYVEKIPYK